MKQKIMTTEHLVITALSLFCDDVRMELGGKLSLVGQYPSDIFVPNPQTSIERIAIVTFARWRSDQPIKSLIARAEVPGLAPFTSQMSAMPEGAGRITAQASLTTAQNVSFLRFPQLRIGDVIRCWLVVDGVEVFAGERCVRLMTPPAHAVAEPPPEATTRH